MRNDKDVAQWRAAASDLRKALSTIVDAHPANRIVLAPGMLIGLQILFASLGVRRIALTNQEYHDSTHFPYFDAQAFPIDDIDDFVARVKRFKPDAAIISLATWRGNVLPVAPLFRQLRAALGKKGVTLVVDYTHAGAVGFPSADRLGADIVCGDVYKWITPPQWESKLAFLWFRHGALFGGANDLFRPFFLATDHESSALSARWVDPHEVQGVVRWLKEHHVDRSVLLHQYHKNLHFASWLATQLGAHQPVKSGILWLDEECREEALPKGLTQLGLVWRPPSGGMRILCRAEAESLCRDEAGPFAIR
jgi:hypothetical protein